MNLPEPALPLPAPKSVPSPSEAHGPQAKADALASVLFDNLLRHRQQEAASATHSVMSLRADSVPRDALPPIVPSLHSGPSTESSPNLILGLPGVGDSLFGFRLRRELGRGSFARVFLAEQAELAGRPVVVKVSLPEGGEPQVLAQLQHTNIVPIYSAQEDLRMGVRLVCMPYLGGAALDQIQNHLWKSPQPPSTGQQLVQSLLASSPTPPPPGSSDLRALDRLKKLTYVQTVLALGAALADGLAHAHQRGIFHRDLKPSNVLLAADGTPLLLDFNLACDPSRESAVSASVGGTLAYMAPEHLRALGNRTQTTALAVDARSDLYSLGIVLFELLTGQRPFEQSGSYAALPVMVEAMALERSKETPSARKSRPDVSWGLESVLQKCLHPDPSRRYNRADQLAEDLRRLLEDRPLAYARELSTRECVGKWLRRHPRLVMAGCMTMLLGVLIVVGYAGFGLVRGQLEDTQDRLAMAQAGERLHQFQAGTARALCLVNTVLENPDHRREGIRACEATLALYGLLDDAEDQDPADWERLTAEQRVAVAEDARELLLLLAGARVQQRPQDANILRESLRLLARAEMLTGLAPSKALWIQRSEYLSALQQPEQASAARQQSDHIPAATARDHYLLASTHMRRGERGSWLLAVRELNQGLALNPRHYWSWVARGLCHQQLGDALRAAGDFGICIGLRPEFAWGHFCRAWLHGSNGRVAEAIEDYTAALRCEPDLVPAWINRGLVQLERKQFAQALADFDQAEKLKARGSLLKAGRGVALEHLGRHAEADLAFTEAFASAETLSPAQRARLSWSYGFAVAARKKDHARQAFEDALRLEPTCAQALYGRALVLSEDQTEEAFTFLDRAIQANPLFMEARRYRGLLHARLGRWNHAALDINWCLEREPESGATLYTAACIAALAADRNGDLRAGEQSVALLRKAVQRGIPLAQIRDDEELAGIRHLPQYRELMGKATN